MLLYLNFKRCVRRVSSENNLRLATQDTEDLTIRKLTYNNPTMKAKFDEARNTQAAVEIKDDEE